MSEQANPEHGTPEQGAAGESTAASEHGSGDSSPDPDDPRLPPDSAGQSSGTRGEDITDREGKEAGRQDTGTQGASERPTGTSTARDVTGVDPQEPIDPESPRQG